MYLLALPFTGLRAHLLEHSSQTIDIINFIAVDSPGFRFHARSCNFAVNRDADALPVLKKFFFDARYVIPRQIDHLTTLTCFNKAL